MKCIVCLSPKAKKVEDPYEADVNNNPGVMVWLCDADLAQLLEEI